MRVVMLHGSASTNTLGVDQEEKEGVKRWALLRSQMWMGISSVHEEKKREGVEGRWSEVGRR
eukprot:3508409-Rhodomonas_salina.2